MAEHRPYFIGIEAPPDLRTVIQAMQSALYRPAKMQRPLVPHITLLHPPSLHGLDVAGMIPRARAAAAAHLPADLTVESVGSFGAKTIYLKLTPSKQLMALHASLVALLPPHVARTHYIQPFMPHITLLQAARGGRLPRLLLEQCQKAATDLLPYHYTVQSIALYTWRGPRDYAITSIL